MHKMKKNKCIDEIGENIVTLTRKCNQDCIFCSTKGKTNIKTNSISEIMNKISLNKQRVSFEGGEPTLCRDLIKWVKKAKKNKIREIILCTNGALLSDCQYANDLIAAGVNLFNINLPSHTKKLHKKLTKSDFYNKTLKGIENLNSSNRKNLIRLTFIINSLNYKSMLSYVEFMRNFSNIFYIEFNLIKVLGYVQDRKHLIPKMSSVADYFYEAMEYCREYGLRVISDGFPLCFMNGFEEFSIDAFKIINRNQGFFVEKTLVNKCKMCSLRRICGGIRKDYFGVRGGEEVRPSLRNPEAIIKKIRH